MPRHFLVKRHKHCAGTFSYRDRLPECHDGADSSSYTSTTIIDTDKHIIIRDGDYIHDYGGYSSPDSGYAASPNSSHICYAREKDSLVTDLENNNNKAPIKTPSAVSYYINNQCNMITISSNSLQHEEATDTPMDLSMHSRKKQTPSSIAVYVEQEDSYKLHHAYQQQQQQQLYYSTPPSHSIAALSTNAAVIRLDSFNKLYLNANTDRSLCAMMSPLSPTRFPYNPSSPYLSGADARAALLCPEAINPDVLLEAQTVAQAENLSRAHCQTVPSLIESQKPLLQSPLLSPSPATLEPAATNDRASPLKTPSPLNSPSRKRAIIEDNDDVSSELYPQDLSKSLPVLKQNDLFNESNPTPVGKKVSSHKARTTAPVLKKSPASMSTGKRLKAVRRLNFDIDTTSPVSGTIIKDAADFHPEDGKVVYGDIEPSFNFVEATPEARAELEKIENKIGDYICQLCKEFYEDAFQLAQHRCSRIVHVEYRCPECDKVFNCPANLASHRRWHKPRVNGQNKVISNGSGKNILTNQKIAPKPDCNSNNVTDMAPASPFKTVHSPNSFLAGMKHGLPVTTEQGVEKDNDKTESILYNRLSLEIVDCNRKQAIPFPKVEDVSMLPISHNNSESKENGYSVMVSGSQSLLSSSIEDQVKKPGTPDNFLYTSVPDQDTCLRPDTVIAMNPLRVTPEAYGSSLTSEERSLVLQVLSCHNRQHQTTTISSTTTVMTPRTSDAHSGSNVGMKPYSDNTAAREKSPSVCHDTIDSLNLTISSQLLASPSLKDVSHTTDLLTNQQKQQLQTGLSEQQVNPQIGCSICGKKFQRQAYLRKHILSQHGKQHGIVKSGGIDNVKAGERDTVNTSHIDSDKTDERASESITKSISITTSSQSSTDSTDDGSHMTKYRFGVAGQMLATESSKIKPEPSADGLTTVLACSTCGITFTSKAALDKHMRCAHASQSFSCKYCTSTFHSSPGLTRHINKCHPTENRRVILLQLPATRTC